MPIRNYHYMHGAAISILVNTREYHSITKLENASQSEYLLNHNAALYMKSAVEDSNQDNKWMFWFSPIHQEQVRRMYDRYNDRSFILLICWPEWICALKYSDYATCLDQNFTENEWLEVTRPDGGGFRVRGKLGVLDRIVPLADYPRVLFEN